MENRNQNMINEIPTRFISNLIVWMRDKGLPESDINDCMLFVCGSEAEESAISKDPRYAMADKIINLVADSYGTTPEKLKSNEDVKELDEARKMAYNLCRAKANLSLDEIRLMFGKIYEDEIKNVLKNIWFERVGNKELDNRLKEIEGTLEI